MIVTARTPEEWRVLTGFLRHYAGVVPSAEMQCIGWVSDEEKKLAIVVGLDGFIGKIAHIHVAYAEGWHFTPRLLLREVFRYAFITAKREMLVGVVNSRNEKAMRMDLHLGFREVTRLPGMHDNGGDVVLLAMKKAECRYLDVPDTVELAQAGSA